MAELGQQRDPASGGSADPVAAAREWLVRHGGSLPPEDADQPPRAAARQPAERHGEAGRRSVGPASGPVQPGQPHEDDDRAGFEKHAADSAPGLGSSSMGPDPETTGEPLTDPRARRGGRGAGGEGRDDREQTGRGGDGRSRSSRRGGSRGGGSRGGGSRATGEPRGDGPGALDGDADPVAVARTIVLRKLAVQARTRQELAKALAAKEVPEPAAQEVLDRMESVGLVDDAAFARDWVQSRQQRRHLSRSALRQELRTKGVDRELIESAVAGVEGEDEVQAAQTLAERKLRTLSGLDRQVQYRRLAGALARRGFSPAVTRSVLASVLDEPPDS